LEKATKLRETINKKNLNIDIEIDGGINIETAKNEILYYLNSEQSDANKYKKEVKI
jgi:hypothetical protein